jgi:hypothetical protein
LPSIGLGLRSAAQVVERTARIDQFGANELRSFAGIDIVGRDSDKLRRSKIEDEDGV